MPLYAPGAGGGGLANLQDYSTFGVKLASGRNSIYDNAQLAVIILDAGVVSLESSGDEVGLYPDNGQVVNIGSGDGLLLPELAADPTAVRDGQIYYNTVTDKFRGYANGAWTDLDAAAHIADATDAHDASAISFDDTGLGITAADVQTMGEQLDAAISAGGIPGTIVDVKGDLIVATAADTVGRLAAGATNGMGLVVASGETTGLKWEWPGAIVQVKTANSVADDATTAATMQDSSLSLAFTPLFADSILHVKVDGECVAYRAAGTPPTRSMWVGIYNSTNAVELSRQIRGVDLISGSTVAAAVYMAITIEGRYIVNSVAARTFVLRYMSNEVTNIAAQLTGSRTGGITMTITEVRP